MRALLVFPAVLAVLICGAAPAAAKPKLCDNRAGETVAATSVGRVFRDVSGTDPVLRGCRHGTRATLRLGVDGDCAEGGAIGQLAAAGRYVALTRVRCDTVSGTSTVVMFDLKNMRDVLGATAYTGDTSASSGITSIGVSELALATNGALAWVGQLNGGGTQRAELHLRRPFVSAPELIASADSFDLTDIAVTSRKLFWLDGGATHAIDL